MTRIVANENRGTRVSLGPKKAEGIGDTPYADLIEAVVQARLPAVGAKANYVGTPIQQSHHQVPRGMPPQSGGS